MLSKSGGRFQRFVGQMLAQHFPVLIDHMGNKFFVLVHIRYGLGHERAVSCGGIEERHV